MGGVSCGSPALLSDRQDSDVAFPAPIHPTVPELKRAAHHQRRCLHRIHLSEVTGSVQRPAVVPLVECGIVVWSRRGDSQSVVPPPWGGCTTPTGDVHTALLPPIPRGSASPTWSHVAHLDLLPGGFLVYKHRRAHQEQFLQSRAAEGTAPCPTWGSPGPAPRSHLRPKLMVRKDTRPILMALCEQLRLPGKPQLKNKGEDKHQVPQVPTRQRDDGRHRC